jgi:hypothetical protein
MTSLRLTRITAVLSLLAALLWARAAAARDLTFFVASDVHFGRNRFDTKNEELNRSIHTSMTSGRLSWPSMVWDVKTAAATGERLGAVARPRGVLMPGDLTDGDSRDWDGTGGGDAELVWNCTKHGTAEGCGCVTHKESCGLVGFGDVWTGSSAGIPVYEGYGNHDVKNVGLSGGDTHKLKAEGRIQKRTPGRPGLVNAGSNGYYSWEWDGVHFVNLNAYAGGNTEYSHGGLAFLRDDLAKHVGTSGKPVVLMQHFGFSNRCTGALLGKPNASWSQTANVGTGCESSKGYTTAAEESAVLAALKPYNVIAILAGHDHHAHTYVTPTNLRVIHTGYGREGQWMMIRIRDNDLLAAPVVSGMPMEAYSFKLR